MSLFDWFRRNAGFGEESPIAPGEQGNALSAAEADARSVLQVFQFVTLPEDTFNNDPQLLNDLTAGSSFLAFSHSQAKAYLHCEEVGMIEPENREVDRATQALFQSISITRTSRDGYTVYALTMPQPHEPPEAHFLGIVHKDGEARTYMQPSPGTRFFTLEKTLGPLPFLCEIRSDGSRRNSGQQIRPTLAEFIDAAFARLARPVPPQHSRIALDKGMAALMMFAPQSSTDYHLVDLEFEDGTRLASAKVYDSSELELPDEYANKKITRFTLLSKQP